MSISEREYAEWRQREGLNPHNPNSYVDKLLESSYLGGYVMGVNYALRVVNEQAAAR